VAGEGWAKCSLNEANLHLIDVIGGPGAARRHRLCGMAARAIERCYARVPLAVAARHLMHIAIIANGADAAINVKVEHD